MMSNNIALKRNVADVVTEYEEKNANLLNQLKNAQQTHKDLEMSCSVGGAYGESLKLDLPYVEKMQDCLLKSAWRFVYQNWNIEDISTANDRKNFQKAIEDPAPFTFENIMGTFGAYVSNPRLNIIRGVAEVFCTLDQAYKSHEKVKIGVKGLPKRVIMKCVANFGWGRDRVQDVINAVGQIRGLPLVSYGQASDFINGKDETKTLTDGTVVLPLLKTHGIWIKTYDNGNGHIYFDELALKDVNNALAEYYGDVLADCEEEKPTKFKESTAVSKDLQYYPTPEKAVNRLIDDLYRLEGEKVLEPSCGCGRIMDKLKENGADVFGVEVDADRADLCRSKGHKVLTANFLEVTPEAEFDLVVMNPPFYGKHYAKHIKHALKFIKPGGRLVSILPHTAKEHGLVDGEWRDLPVGSFSESGTNINTTILTIRVKD